MNTPDRDEMKSYLAQLDESLRRMMDDHLKVIVVDAISKHEQECYDRHWVGVDKKLDMLVAAYHKRNGGLMMWAAVGRVVTVFGVVAGIVFGILSAL